MPDTGKFQYKINRHQESCFNCSCDYYFSHCGIFRLQWQNLPLRKECFTKYGPLPNDSLVLADDLPSMHDDSSTINAFEIEHNMDSISTNITSKDIEGDGENLSVVTEPDTSTNGVLDHENIF